MRAPQAGYPTVNGWMPRSGSFAPEDNPARLVSSYSYLPPRHGTETNPYEAVLTGPDGQEFWREAFDHRVSADDNQERDGGLIKNVVPDTDHVTVKTFTVNTAGEYVLRVKQTAAGFTEKSFQMGFSRNVLLVQPLVVAAGIVSLTGGSVLITAGQKRDRKKKREKRRASAEAAAGA